VESAQKKRLEICCDANYGGNRSSPPYSFYYSFFYLPLLEILDHQVPLKAVSIQRILGRQPSFDEF